MSLNLDKFKGLPQEVRSQIEAALEGGTNEGIVEAVTMMARSIEANILAEAKSLQNRSMEDYNVLMQRGQAQLTQEEREYYKAVQENRGFTDLEITMPTTVFDRVFEELENSHALLSKISFTNTTGITKWLMSRPGTKMAAWGMITSAITKELEAGFKEEDMTQCKLSAFMPVSQDMLILGAVWLDRYVRAVLQEAISNALEEAIIKGTGKDMPIGMMKDLDGAVVGNVYSDKEAVAITDLSPKTLGKEVMAKLTRDGKVTVNTVLIVVNPLDYWSKIFPATTILTDNGTYAKGVLPIPCDIVQSVHMPVGKMVCGISTDYFMGVGANSKIMFSDEYKFLEDTRIYATKMLCNGKPKDNQSFLVFDISTLGDTLAKAKTK
ncbi:MAG: phage major capsid protein [Paraclostridium sp.]